MLTGIVVGGVVLAGVGAVVYAKSKKNNVAASVQAQADAAKAKSDIDTVVSKAKSDIDTVVSKVKPAAGKVTPPPAGK